MPLITIEDLSTHIYPEGMDVISRDDDSNVQEAIDSAILQASQYLGRYNVATIFATEDAEEKKKYSNLITYVKDIAKWHFIAVANVTVDLDLAERRYTAAMRELKDIRNNIQPGWPLLDPEVSDRPFSSGSNLKFNHFGF
tara:strand:- start:92 stop:511 length:420 start_codon:yes stop_codon:yes gene_type:complete